MDRVSGIGKLLPGFDQAMVPAGSPLPASELREIAIAFRRAEIVWERFGPRLLFAPGGYSRVRVWSDGDRELLLLGWLPGQRTEVHDHGGSWGLARVLFGELVEAQWDRPVGGGPLRIRRESRIRTGRVATESIDAIHRLENRSGAPAASLHFYSKPIERMGVWDPATGRRRLVRVNAEPGGGM